MNDAHVSQAEQLKGAGLCRARYIAHAGAQC